MRLLVNRCDDIFGRISTTPVEIDASTLISGLKSQLALLHKLPEIDIILKTSPTADAEAGFELRNEQSVESAGLREGDTITMEMRMRDDEVSSPSHGRGEGEEDDDEEEKQVPKLKSKAQWLSLLLQLCRVGNHKAMLRLLSDYEMEVTSNMIEVDEDELISKSGPEGWTPLHFACHKGHTQIVQTLCSRKACPNIESADHWTPLQLAAYHGHVDCKD